MLINKLSDFIVLLKNNIFAKSTPPQTSTDN